MSLDDQRVDWESTFDGVTCARGIEAVSWREADRQLRRIAARRAALDVEEAHWILVARRADVHVPLGFATFLEYVERRLGYAPHTALERLRVAEALEQLPATREALAEGQASYSGIREISRIATPETEREWLAAIEGKTVREIEALVSGRAPGDVPSDPPDADLEPRSLTLELTPDVYGLFLQARRHLEDTTGERLSDSDLARAMCEAVLSVGGRESAPVCPELVLTVCEVCDRARLDAAGQTLDVSPEIVAEVRCDIAARKAVPRGTRRTVWQRDHSRCSVPGCRASRYLHLHHIVARAEGGSNDASNLILLCSAHHRALHHGRLSITGQAPAALQFTHRDGQKYGAPPPPPPPDVFADATAALIGLDFKPAEANAAVARARSHVGPDTPLEDVIRACLRECGSARRRDGC